MSETECDPFLRAEDLIMSHGLIAHVEGGTVLSAAPKPKFEKTNSNLRSGREVAKKVSGSGNLIKWPLARA